MINVESVKNFCKDDISLIENYNPAIADKEQTWQCHHRRELETPRKKLIEIGEYFNRPASELIFLTPFEHNSLHASLKFKGNKNMLGKHHTDETKIKISETLKGHKLYEETKLKMSEARKGLHWFNNGIIAVIAKTCPEGFVSGRIKK